MVYEVYKAIGTLLLITLIPSATYNVKPAVIKEKPIKLETREQIIPYIKEKAIEYGVDPTMALFVASHESINFHEKVLDGTITGDNHLICPETGEYIRSRGVWQINNCAWPYISDKEAFDIVSSTNWAMNKLKESPEIWTAYQIYVQTRR